MRDAFCMIELKGKMMGLKINEKKTKYIKLSAVDKHHKVQNITNGEYCFERLKEFLYLGSSLNNSNNMMVKI
jgi:hypothetical protein